LDVQRLENSTCRVIDARRSAAFFNFEHLPVTLAASGAPQPIRRHKKPPGSSINSVTFANMNALLKQHLPQIEQACRNAGVMRLFVFGSVLTDQFGDGSDVDFVAEFVAMLPADYAERYFQLCEALEAILERPVDVLTPAGIRNPIFRRELEQKRQLLYSLPAA